MSVRVWLVHPILVTLTDTTYFLSPYPQASKSSAKKANRPCCHVCRLLHDAIQPPDETATLAWAQLVLALGQAGAIRHPPQVDHLGHAGHLLVHLPFFPDRTLSGMVHSWLRNDLHDGPRVFACA